MAKISALTAAGSSLGADEFPVNEAGTTKKVTITQLLALIFGGLTAFTGAFNPYQRTVAQATDASAVTAGAGAVIFVTNAGGNGPCLCISDGAHWKRSDNAST